MPFINPSIPPNPAPESPEAPATCGSYTIQHLIAINQAIASGALTVEYDGRRVTYRSVEDLLRAKITIESYLNSTTGKVITRQHRMEPRSGF